MTNRTKIKFSDRYFPANYDHFVNAQSENFNGMLLEVSHYALHSILKDDFLTIEQHDKLTINTTYSHGNMLKFLMYFFSDEMRERNFVWTGEDVDRVVDSYDDKELQAHEFPSDY